MFNGKFQSRELGASEEDLLLYDEIFQRNGDPRNMDVLRWRFRDGPTDHSILLLAKDTSDVKQRSAAFYGILGVPFRAGGRNISAGQSLDTLTDKGYRRQGLFVWLAEEAYRLFSERGASVVYGFPNPNSHPTFARRLGWHTLGTSPFVIKPLRSGYFLRAVLSALRLPSGMAGRLDFPLGRFDSSGNEETGGLDIRRLELFGADHNALWLDFSIDVRVCVDRTADYLNWRIFKHPAANYRALGAYRGDALVAEVVWCIKERHGGVIGYVMEMLQRRGEAAAGRTVLLAAVSDMYRSGADAALAWNLRHSPNNAVFSSCGFRPLPDRLRPSNIYWGFRCFDPALQPLFERCENWYLSYIDSDTT